MKQFASHGSGDVDRSAFARLGDNVVFEPGSMVFHAENIEIGSNVYVGHYAILKAFAAFERVGERVPGLEIPDLDIVQLARGHGCEGRRVQRAADLEDALRAAFADAWRSKAPIVVEVEIEREVPPLL